MELFDLRLVAAAEEARQDGTCVLDLVKHLPKIGIVEGAEQIGCGYLASLELVRKPADAQRVSRIPERPVPHHVPDLGNVAYNAVAQHRRLGRIVAQASVLKIRRERRRSREERVPGGQKAVDTGYQLVGQLRRCRLWLVRVNLSCGSLRRHSLVDVLPGDLQIVDLPQSAKKVLQRHPANRLLQRGVFLEQGVFLEMPRQESRLAHCLYLIADRSRIDDDQFVDVPSDERLLCGVPRRDSLVDNLLACRSLAHHRLELLRRHRSVAEIRKRTLLLPEHL